MNWILQSPLLDHRYRAASIGDSIPHEGDHFDIFILGNFVIDIVTPGEITSQTKSDDYDGSHREEEQINKESEFVVIDGFGLEGLCDDIRIRIMGAWTLQNFDWSNFKDILFVDGCEILVVIIFEEVIFPRSKF